jgi:signal transduction histidine kinase
MGGSLLSRLKIAIRIDLLLVIAAVGMVICSGIGLWTLRKQMLEDRRVQLRNVMELVIQHALGDMNEKGGPQSEAGRNAFFDMLGKIRYGDNLADYFFSFDYNGVLLLHPNREMVGSNYFNRDFNGFYATRKFIEIALSPSGSGFVEYNYGMHVRKLAHIRNVPELHALVGLGIRVEDVDALFMARLRDEAWLFAVTLPLISLCCFAVSRSITGPLSNILCKITRLAKGDLDIPPAHEVDRSELGNVANAIEILRCNAIEQRELQEKVHQQNEQLLEQMQKAEQAVTAKSEFLANMSHELRTPMHAILGYADISLTDINEGTPQSVGKYIENIKTSGERLLRLLNDLLVLAKLDSGKIEYKCEPADLKEAVDNTLIELAPLIKAKNLEICASFGGCTEACFDRHYIIQVLINLLSNAIKVSGAGDRIGIEVFEERPASGGPELCCKVTDSGPGIPDGELTAIFDKFVQSTKTKTGAGGTGLGLAICQKIIQDHGGNIWAENAKPKGAVFTFVIPKEVLSGAVSPLVAVDA